MVCSPANEQRYRERASAIEIEYGRYIFEGESKIKRDGNNEETERKYLIKEFENKQTTETNNRKTNGTE